MSTRHGFWNSNWNFLCGKGGHKNIMHDNKKNINNVLEVSNLNKFVGSKQILKDVNFTVPAGSITAFIGGSGSGKTTTIKTILDLYKMKSGAIKILGSDYDDLNIHYRIGYVPEKENFPKKSAMKFLHRMSELYDLDSKTINNRIAYYSGKLDIINNLNDKLINMSSGQKKRIMIIQALINEPELLIMDEPTENLDPDNRDVFYKIIKELNSKGKTIFISSHNLAEIESYVNYAVIIASGEIKYQGAVKKGHGELKKIYEKYKN
jgi:ABC-2 type transport system ATP-binding protein